MALRHISPLLALLLACSSSVSPPLASDSGSNNADSAAGDSGMGIDGDAGPDTWTSYAAGFFKSYCTACHNTQDSTGRDFNIQAKVEAEKFIARCGVAVAQDPSWNCAASPVAKQFPIGSGPKPSDAERTRIVAWITAGAP